MSDDHDHDDRHDRGLLFDLQTLLARPAEPPRFERRGALKLLAGAGAGLVLVACGSDSPAATTATTGATTTTTSGGTTSTTAAPAGTPTDAIPEETAGPYPGDGSNGPDVLTASGIVRQDIRSSFGDLTGTAEGVPLTIQLTVETASTGKAQPGAAVYLWHCTREGGYSLYSSGVTDQNFLRGVQEADSNGVVTFTSIFPACYSGRWPHIHFEVFNSLADATSAGSRLVTSQLALPQDACELVYATSGYEQSVQNLAQTSLATDMVFSDGADHQLAAITGNVTKGMTASLVVPV